MDFFHFATTNAMYEFRPKETAEERRQREYRAELVTKYLTKPIVVTPVGGGEDK